MFIPPQRIEQNEKLMFAGQHDPFSDQTIALDWSLWSYTGGNWNSQTFSLVLFIHIFWKLLNPFLYVAVIQSVSNWDKNTAYL